MDKIKLFKFLIIFFLSLNFITLISGYFFYIDFENSQNNWYSKQTDINLRKESVLLNNKQFLNQEFLNLTKDLETSQVKIDDINSQIKILQGGPKNSSNLDSLNSQLASLKLEESNLISKKDSLNNDLIRKISRQSRKVIVPVVTSSAS